jgi:hypothetical protein
MSVEPIIIKNPIRSPEEMAEILGMSPERVEAIRRIMDTPVSRKRSVAAAKAVNTPLRTRSSSRRSTGRPAKKK